MIISILDGYTDEPSGLGVPPFLGTYPRYLFGAALKHTKDVFYIRIDDLRYKGNDEINRKTNIFTKNKTKNFMDAERILKNSSIIIAIAGINTPGKYLSAMPASLNEIIRYIRHFKGYKILTGPAAYSSLSSGGRTLNKNYYEMLKEFDLTISGDLWAFLESLIKNTKKKSFKSDYHELRDYAIAGAEILNQINPPAMIELETGRGCPRKAHCSFCLEPIKNKRFEFRDYEDIIEEVKALKRFNARYFRLGKQSDFYSYPYIKELLSGIKRLNPEVLHIDNVDPLSVITKRGEDITKEIVKYCTPGNVAAFGVESFDMDVIKQNNLNATPETTLKAIEIINKHGHKKGHNGLPMFLPGINIILGLIGETKKTLETNLHYLKEIYRRGLLLRRINIRQVDVFPGTRMAEVGLKYLKKNKKYYYRFRRAVREEIDMPMLKSIFPAGTIIRDVFMEIHDGNHTFGRQIATYPIIIGINKKLVLNKFYDVKITGHMLRSLTGEIINQKDDLSISGNPLSREESSE